MERRDLGQTGLKVPVIGVGARRSFDVFGKEAQRSRRSLVDVALAEGANLFETSPEYGDADGILGSALTGRRGSAIVAATISSHDERLAHSQIDRALRLFEERIDILMVERPADWPTFEQAFRQMKSDRSLRIAGISCAQVEDFDLLEQMMLSQPIDVIQITYHPGEERAAEVILPLAMQRGIGVIAAQPFDGGNLLDVALSGATLASLAPFGLRTTPQTILKWILSDRRISSVLPGTRRVRHLRDNLMAADPPWLGHDDRALLASIFARLE